MIYFFSLSFHISVTFKIRSFNPIVSNPDSRGKYVPAKNGFLSGVMIMVNGHPPVPVMI